MLHWAFSKKGIPMSLAEITAKKRYITFKEIDDAVEAAAGVVKPRLDPLSTEADEKEEDLKSLYAYAVTYAIAYKSAGTPPSFVLANQSVTGQLKQRLKARGLDPESLIEAVNLAIQTALRQQQQNRSI
jgi:hypothetical protein